LSTEPFHLFWSGVQDQNLQSCGEGECVILGGACVEPVFPERVHPAAGMDASEGEDFVHAWLAPEHSRLLASFSDERAAAGFDDAGADEVVFGPEGSVLHTGAVVHEVAQSGFHLRHIATKEGLFACLLDDVPDPNGTNLRLVWDAAPAGQILLPTKTRGGVRRLPDLPWAFGFSPIRGLS